jgi:ribosome maturation factor RimP
MISKDKIKTLIEPYLKEHSLFHVDSEITPDNDIRIIIESQDSVGIDDCANLSRIIEQGLNREEEDYSLTVSSAGLDMPFKVLQQYQKYLGKEVEVILKKGVKIIATLTSADEKSITLSRVITSKKDGVKRPVKEEITEIYDLDAVKSTKPHINFK